MYYTHISFVGQSLCKASVTNPPGPVRFSPPGGLPWILETVRVPYDFPFYRVCGHICYGARAVPGENLWSEIARSPSTNRPGAGRHPAGMLRAPSDNVVHRTAPGRCPTGARAGIGRAPCGARLGPLPSAHPVFKATLSNKR